jgi:lon-related putative ATP-dependent protease
MDPQPIPLEVKVVLLGNRELYHLLQHYDADFDALFKIVADFDDYVAWDDENQKSYASMLARLVRDSHIRHLTADAVASTLEHSARLVEDRRRLSARVRDVEDILREADQLAAQEGTAEIHARHIDRVIMERAYRVDRIRELVHENITRGVTVVETQGARVGQINGLSVVQIGKLVFGQPSRITATARIGRGELIDIEREARLGGNIHTKAVMIVSNFIGARYAREQPLSLHASLVFEQSYGGIEGDSASIAEVCALISAIIERPLRQDLAVTGSMDQHGKVQAIGGVNQKIEGFFDICNVQGLTGTQGVLIPRTNRDDLMLREDVVDAAAAGRFHVYDMATVDDALAVLFAGPDGSLADPADIDSAVRGRLKALHDMRMQGSKDSGEQ